MKGKFGIKPLVVLDGMRVGQSNRLKMVDILLLVKHNLLEMVEGISG